MRWMILAVGLVSASGLAAQQTTAPQAATLTDAQRMLETRADLESLLAELRETAASTAYSETLRARARDEARLIEDRLRDGDFRTGDRVFVSIALQGETWLADTLEVDPGPSVYIDPIGSIALDGLLRSEFRGHLQTELERYLRDPVIRSADPTIRLAIVGVTQQGEFYLPAITRIGTAISGQAPTADFEGIEIYRTGELLWDADAVARARQEGRTLDQMSLQAGDEIRIPQRAQQLLIAGGQAARSRGSRAARIPGCVDAGLLSAEQHRLPLLEDDVHRDAGRGEAVQVGL